MGVLLKLVFLAVIALLAFRILQRALGLPGAARPGVDPPPQQVMRRCAHCRVHVPEGESTQSRGEYFCCESHRDAYMRERR